MATLSRAHRRAQVPTPPLPPDRRQNLAEAFGSTVAVGQPEGPRSAVEAEGGAQDDSEPGDFVLTPACTLSVALWCEKCNAVAVDLAVVLVPWWAGPFCATLCPSCSSPRPRVPWVAPLFALGRSRAHHRHVAGGAR